MIALEHVSKTYLMDKKIPVLALQDVSMQVAAGEFVVITGRSGSGKTTLLNLAAGLTRPTEGVVTFHGREIWQLPDGEAARLRQEQIGFVFQFPSLMPSLTVEENVLLPTIFGQNRSTQLTARAHQLLDEVGLADKRRAYPRQLSAGQQQRVVIARALINEPELLLADEPTSDLDEQTEAEVMELFRTIHQARGLTIMLVTHTLELVRFGSRAIRMVGGRIAETNAIGG
jgi:ABC-type lipoprotein export system ATPase subunit